MKLFQKTIIILSIFIFSFLLVGCKYKNYKGKYPELYTIAINSLLWNNGHSYGADRAKDSDIIIKEEDTFGRIMFVYQERYYVGGELAYTSLIICQKTVDKYVYYYPDYNFVIKEKESLDIEIQDFSDEEIQKLKLLNDWDNEVDLEKCIKNEIINKKTDPNIDKSEFVKIFKNVFKNEDINNVTVRYLTCDNYSRTIYYGHYRGNNKFEFLVMIFDENGICNLEKGVLIPNDLYEYQEELKAFKELNNWNLSIY